MTAETTAFLIIPDWVNIRVLAEFAHHCPEYPDNRIQRHLIFIYWHICKVYLMSNDWNNCFIVPAFNRSFSITKRIDLREVHKATGD
jgi:hypothetical protein